MKKYLPLPLLLIVLLCVLLLFACGQSTPAPTAEEKAADLFTAFAQKERFGLDGYVLTGEQKTTISGTVDVKNRAIKVVDDATTLYYGKTLFTLDGDSYTVSSIDASYAACLDMVPFSAISFTYDKDDCESTLDTGDHIVVTFGGEGVKRCFNTNKNISGGVLTVGYDKNGITSTYLSTTLLDGSTHTPYCVRYTYSDGEVVDTDVDVRPTDGVPYAVYGSAQLVEINGNKTLCYNTHDTGAGLEAILPTRKSEYVSPSDVENAFVIDEETSVTLNIVYTSNKTVIGLGSGVHEVAVTYKKSDFSVLSVIINNGLTYTLE